jgi:hypothetical protein
VKKGEFLAKPIAPCTILKIHITDSKNGKFRCSDTTGGVKNTIFGILWKLNFETKNAKQQLWNFPP